MMMMDEVHVVEKKRMCETNTMEHRLIEAARTDDVSTVRRILRKPGAVNVDFRDNMGNSALLGATTGGHTEIVRLLLEVRCYVNVPSGLLVRPLHVAAKGGHTDIIKLLLNAGAAVDAETQDGYTPIQHSVPNSPAYSLLQNHKAGSIYELENKEGFLPKVPQYAIIGDLKKEPTGKKGKKGKKGGKKTGKKKGGKKKKK